MMSDKVRDLLAAIGVGAGFVAFYLAWRCAVWAYLTCGGAS